MTWTFGPQGLYKKSQAQTQDEKRVKKCSGGFTFYARGYEVLQIKNNPKLQKYNVCMLSLIHI